MVFCKLEEKGMVQFLASFSIQFVITCIMQLRRGEAYVLNKIILYYVTDQNFMLIGLMIPTCTSVNNDKCAVKCERLLCSCLLHAN